MESGGLELSGRKVKVITDWQFNVYDAQLQNVTQFGSVKNDLGRTAEDTNASPSKTSS